MDQSSGLFAKALTVGAYTAVFHFTAVVAYMGFFYGPSSVWMGAFVLTDFAYYWAHRTSHEVNLLWIGHSVHHQSEDYNLGVALRQSVLQKVLLMWVYWPLAALGFPPEMFLTSMAINLLYQFWIHTELIDRMGPLEWVLNTPSHHRVHHGRNPEYIDRNHAGVFIIWDRMFGTFQEEIVKPTYGVTRPTDSFNPVYAQWKPVADLWRDLRAIPGWLDRVRFLFAPPGWYPESVGGSQSAPDITGEEVKFNPRPSNALALACFCFAGCCSWPSLSEHCNPLKPARMKPLPLCWAGSSARWRLSANCGTKAGGGGVSFRRGCRCGFRPGDRPARGRDGLGLSAQSGLGLVVCSRDRLGTFSVQAPIGHPELPAHNRLFPSPSSGSSPACGGSSAGAAGSGG